MWSTEVQDEKLFREFLDSKTADSIKFSNYLQNNDVKKAILLINDIYKYKGPVLSVMFYLLFGGNVNKFLSELDDNNISSVISYSWDAIKNDTDLDWIIPKNITKLSSLNYIKADNLETQGSVSIEPACFSSCDFKKVNISTAKTVGSGAFSNCSMLEEVIFGDACEVVPLVCFDGCEKLRKVHLGKNIKKIYPNAFRNCSDDLLIEIEKPVRGISMTTETYNQLKSHIKWVN